MAEPNSSVGLGVAALMKITGLTFGALIGTIVVMVLSHPRTKTEWAIALTSTILMSICGGAWLAVHTGLNQMAADPMVVAALIGQAFVAGLPAWVTIRTVFAINRKALQRAVLTRIRNAVGSPNELEGEQ